MMDRGIETCLVKKVAQFIEICTNCNKEIPIGEFYYLEEGLTEHLHSLIARRFCSPCYSKYGERILIKVKEK